MAQASLHLPREILLCITYFLDNEADVLSLGLVSHRFHNIILSQIQTINNPGAAKLLEHFSRPQLIVKEELASLNSLFLLTFHRIFKNGLQQGWIEEFLLNERTEDPKFLEECKYKFEKSRSGETQTMTNNSEEEIDIIKQKLKSLDKKEAWRKHSVLSWVGRREGEYREWQNNTWLPAERQVHLHIIAMYKHGELDGEWKMLDHNGNMISSKEYVNGQQHGIHRTYLNGEINSSCSYFQGVRHGLEIHRFQDGCYSETNWSGGLINGDPLRGEKTMFFTRQKTGRIRVWVAALNAGTLRHGVAETFTANGVKSSQTFLEGWRKARHQNQMA